MAQGLYDSSERHSRVLPEVPATGLFAFFFFGGGLVVWFGGLDRGWIGQEVAFACFLLAN